MARAGIGFTEALTPDPVLHRAHLVHLEKYEEVEAEARQDLANRIAIAVWGEE